MSEKRRSATNSDCTARGQDLTFQRRGSAILPLIQAVCPLALEAVLTDNGSETQRHSVEELATPCSP